MRSEGGEKSKNLSKSMQVHSAHPVRSSRAQTMGALASSPHQRPGAPSCGVGEFSRQAAGPGRGAGGGSRSHAGERARQAPPSHLLQGAPPAGRKHGSPRQVGFPASSLLTGGGPLSGVVKEQLDGN